MLVSFYTVLCITGLIQIVYGSKIEYHEEHSLHNREEVAETGFPLFGENGPTLLDIENTFIRLQSSLGIQYSIAVLLKLNSDIITKRVQDVGSGNGQLGAPTDKVMFSFWRDNDWVNTTYSFEDVKTLAEKYNAIPYGSDVEAIDKPWWAQTLVYALLEFSGQNTETRTALDLAPEKVLEILTGRKTKHVSVKTAQEYMQYLPKSDYTPIIIGPSESQDASGFYCTSSVIVMGVTESDDPDTARIDAMDTVEDTLGIRWIRHPIGIYGLIAAEQNTLTLLEDEGPVF